jgi:hypothetical protein
MSACLPSAHVVDTKVRRHIGGGIGRLLRSPVLLAIRASCAAASILVCFAGGSCEAHQKWLLPNFFMAAKAPVWLSFDVTWSDTPFTAEAGVGKQPVSVVGPDGVSQTPSGIFVGKTKSVAEVELTKLGTYRLEAIDPLTYWTQVEKDGKVQWVRKPKNEVAGLPIKRSDLYWSKAAAYVTLGAPSDVPRPNDEDPLDILLGQHPNRVTAGDTLQLRVVSYGKPLPNAEIKLFTPEARGHEASMLVKCDDNGQAAIAAETAGRCLVVCQLERTVTDDPQADLHAFNMYLTLEIQPRDQ